MTSPEETKEVGIVPGNLSLETLVDLPDIGVEIDGKWYAYAPHWRWSLLERSKFGSMYRDMLAIERKDNPVAKDQQRFTELQIELCTFISNAPEDVIAALPSDGQRSAMIIDFLTKSGAQAINLIPKEHQALLTWMNTSQVATGASSSPASKPRTVATKNGGRISPGRSLRAM